MERDDSLIVDGPRNILHLASSGPSVLRHGLTGKGLALDLQRRNDVALVVSLLHTFAPSGQEGYDPNPLVVGPDGNIYGTTQGGGLVACGFSGCGTFFKLTINGADGTFQTLHFFTDAEFGYSGGSQIYEANLGRAILGDDGYFYQSAVGRGGTGLVYKITTSGAYQALSSIDNTNGYTPGQLVQGTDHNFYGSTYPAGSNSTGAIFRVTPSGNFPSWPRSPTTPAKAMARTARLSWETEITTGSPWAILVRTRTTHLQACIE